MSAHLTARHALGEARALTNTLSRSGSSSLGVSPAEAAHLRLVPLDPDPEAFPHAPWACDLRPALCAQCTVSACGYTPRPTTPAVPHALGA